MLNAVCGRVQVCVCALEDYKRVFDYGGLGNENTYHSNLTMTCVVPKGIAPLTGLGLGNGAVMKSCMCFSRPVPNLIFYSAHSHCMYS